MQSSADLFSAVKIKNPCPASWDEMEGNDRARFCKLCKLNVYNLSGMTREQASNLLAEKEGRLCVRYFQREDGTILTEDCSVVRASRARRHAATMAMFCIMFLACGVLAQSGYSLSHSDFELVRNSYVYQFKPVKAAVDWAEKTLAPPPPPTFFVMGDLI